MHLFCMFPKQFKVDNAERTHILRTAASTGYIRNENSVGVPAGEQEKEREIYSTEQWKAVAYDKFTR